MKKTKKLEEGNNKFKKLINEEQINYSESLMEEDKKQELLEKKLDEYKNKIEVDKKIMNNLENKIKVTEDEKRNF